MIASPGLNSPTSTELLSICSGLFFGNNRLMENHHASQKDASRTVECVEGVSFVVSLSPDFSFELLRQDQNGRP